MQKQKKLASIAWPDSSTLTRPPPLRGLKSEESVKHIGTSICPTDYNEKGIMCYEIPKTLHLRKYTTTRSITKKLITWHDILETLPVPFFQYKIARCGSTLLSNILATDPRWKIVSEPFARIPCFSRLLESYKTQRQPQFFILKKILEILTIKESPEQQFCYINLSSLSIFRSNIFKQIFPKTIHYFLWRHPKNIASSLARNPPPWKSQFMDIGEYIEKTMHAIPDDMIVFYYGHIVQFLLPYWIYTSVGLDFLTDAPIAAMRSILQRDAKDPNQPFQRKTVPLRIADIYSYNNTVIDFELRHPPWKYIHNCAQDVPTFSFSNDPSLLIDHIKKGIIPMLLKNYTEIPDIDISKICKKKPLWILKAHRENYFVYGSRSSLRYPITLGHWEKNDYASWKLDPSAYISDPISEFTTSSEETAPLHPPLMESLHCKKKINDNCKKPNCSCQQRIDYPIIRISHKGAVSCAHMDLEGSLLYNIKGKKTVLLFSPEQSEKMGIYPEPLVLARRIIANIAYFNPTLFTQVDLTKAYRATIRAKEMLYFPPGWCHFFITEEEETVSLGWRLDKQGLDPQKIKHPTGPILQMLTEAQMPDYHKGLPVIEWKKISQAKKIL